MGTKIFAKTIENEALNQITELEKSDAYKGCKIRIMPDVHAGKGCTIGTTIKLKDKLVPNTIGVDICCGMLVFELGNIDIDFDALDHLINDRIPSGMNTHDSIAVRSNPPIECLNCLECVDVDLAMRSIGTLGGGNHFIEIDVDDDGNKYLVIHSGSRNLGVRVCNYYQKLAVKRMNDNSDDINKIIDHLKAQGRQREISDAIKAVKQRKNDKELAYLDGDDFKKYIQDMNVLQIYAHSNRWNIGKIILEHLGINPAKINSFETLHNYIDTNTMTLRKGAIRANKNERVIIPINMRDGSLICVGKGNVDWNCSAPHGAGRLMSRKKANKNLSIEDFNDDMSGVYSSSVCLSTLDESPRAYKPMSEIIECIKDTVEIIKVIKPIYNFKAK